MSLAHAEEEYARRSKSQPAALLNEDVKVLHTLASGPSSRVERCAALLRVIASGCYGF